MEARGSRRRRWGVGLLTAVAMICTLAPAGIVSASVPDGTVTLGLVPSPPAASPPSTATTVVLSPGQSVTLTVQATVYGSTYGLGSWDVKLGYNAAVVVETACTGSCSGPDSNPVIISNASPSGDPNSPAPYDLGSVTFKAVGVGSTTLDASSSVFQDVHTNPMTNEGLAAGTVDVIVVPPPPVIASIQPGAGPAGGGVAATVYGTHIQQGATVTFGGAPALSYAYNGCNADTPSICGSVTVRVPADALTAFGSVTGSVGPTSVDALCILRNVAGLGATADCPSSDWTTVAPVQLTNPDGQSASGSFTYWNYDVSASDGGTASATDALCVLRAAVGMPYTAGCPAPAH